MSRRRLGFNLTFELPGDYCPNAKRCRKNPSNRGAISYTPQPRRSLLKKIATLAAVAQGIYTVITRFIPLWNRYSSHRVPPFMP